MFDFDKAKEIYQRTMQVAAESEQIVEEMENMLKTDGMKLSDYAEVFLLSRKCQEAMKDASTGFSNMVTHIGYSVLPEAMEQQDVTSVKTATGYRVTLNRRMNVKMLDKILGFQWLRDNNLGDLITETVNAQTLGSQVRQMMENEGIEPPDSVFEVKPSKYASMTKAG